MPEDLPFDPAVKDYLMKDPVMADYCPVCDGARIVSLGNGQWETCPRCDGEGLK